MFRTEARSATSLSPGGRALGMRGLAWRQGTIKRNDNIRKRFSSRGITQIPRALHTGVLNLVLLPQPLIAMPGHRLRPFYGPSHYQRRPGHHQAIAKPALAIGNHSPSPPWPLPSRLWPSPNHYQAHPGHNQVGCSHYRAITNPALAITEPLPSPP